MKTSRDLKDVHRGKDNWTSRSLPSRNSVSKTVDLRSKTKKIYLHQLLWASGNMFRRVKNLNLGGIKSFHENVLTFIVKRKIVDILRKENGEFLRQISKVNYQITLKLNATSHQKNYVWCSVNIYVSLVCKVGIYQSGWILLVTITLQRTEKKGVVTNEHLTSKVHVQN